MDKRFQVGESVSWVAAGKVSRLEGTKGTVVTGKVVSIDLAEQTLSVMPDHRLIPGAMFQGMGSCVYIKDVVNKG